MALQLKGWWITMVKDKKLTLTRTKSKSKRSKVGRDSSVLGLEISRVPSSQQKVISVH